MKTCGIGMAIALVIAGCATEPSDGTSPLAGDEVAYARAAGRQDTRSQRAGVKTMTAEEIRAWAGFLTEADDISSTLSKQSDALQATRARLSAEEKQVDHDRKLVDARAEKQVKAFNARVQSMHDSVRSFNRSIDEYNASVQRANSLQRSFNVQCADRPYRLADLMALSAKERAAMKTGSTPFDLPVYSDKPAPRIEDLRSRDRE